MSRGISTRAQDYDPAEDLPPCEDDVDVSDLACVPRAQPPSKQSENGFARMATTTQQPRARRTLKDPRVQVSEGFTQDQHEEEVKQRRLMERVRELASKQQK
jgi:hypothetical protein